MRRFALLVCSALLFAACGTATGPAKNPDPNHSHADFTVWIDGKQIDFSGPQYMSGNAGEGTAAVELDQYFHLHDGNGHVMHRHKPGLPLSEFFDSLPGIHFDGDQFTFKDCLNCEYAKGTFKIRLFVNGTEKSEGAAYVLTDLDHILITNAVDPVELRKEERLMTDDACLYSKTCPERGKAPTEGCIADPTVPCKL